MCEQPAVPLPGPWGPSPPHGVSPALCGPWWESCSAPRQHGCRLPCTQRWRWHRLLVTMETWEEDFEPSQRNFCHTPHSHPHPHPPPRSATTEVTGVGPWALLGAGSVEPTAAVCQPWDSVPSLTHGLVLLNWAKTTSWPHGGAVSPSRRAVSSWLVTHPLGRFGPSPGLLSGCAPFSHAGGDREGRGAPAVQDHRQPLGGRLPPRAEQRAGRTPQPEVKAGKGIAAPGHPPLLQTPGYAVVPNTEICP